MHGLAFLLSGVLSSSSGFRSLLEAFQVSGKLFSQGSADHGFSSRLRARTPTPPPYTPAPLAPFSSFLAFSLALFFLSGLLGEHPSSFSQRTPPSPHPYRQKKRARRIAGFLFASTSVSKEPASHNSPLVDKVLYSRGIRLPVTNLIQ